MSKINTSLIRLKRKHHELDNDNTKELAATKLQKVIRQHHITKKTLATQWVNNQLNIQKLTATDLLFKITNKETIVPSDLSLHLVLDSLFDKEADVNAKDKDGWTPLHWAVREGYPEIAKLLIEHGADVNTMDYKGYTTLHLVLDNPEIAKLLIEHGADVNATDNYGDTLLHLDD